MSYLKKTMKFVLVCSISAYLSAVAYLYFLQENLIFPAPSEQSRSEVGTPFEKFIIDTANGEQLLTFHHRAEDSEATIILFHGNGGTASGYFNKAKTWVEAGFGALLVEYRGYPGSTGAPSEEAFFKDALTVYDAIEKQSNQPIIIYGHSLGSGVATYLASNRDPAALILEAPFDALVNIAADRYPWVPVYPLTRHKFESNKYIGHVKAPILILHGTADRTVPIEYGQKLLAAAPEETKFVTLEGAGHSNLSQFGANQIAIEFMTRSLTGVD